MPISLVGGRVWDGLAAEAVEASVVIDGGVIGAVGGEAPGTTIDVSGCTVLPGLIEAHAHLCFNAAADWREAFDNDSPTRMALRMAQAAELMVGAGITTVRDLGAPTELAIEVRDALRAGLAQGPDLFVAGAPVTTTGGHCWFLGGETDGELGIRVRVRELAKAGVDWVKVMATGGGMTPGTNVAAAQFTVDELKALVDEAARLGLRVAAHCHGTPGIANAAAAGVATIEHCSFRLPQGMAWDAGVGKSIAEAGVAVSPTVHSGYLRAREAPYYDERLEIARGLIDAGCTIIMSTDCGIPNTPHDILPESMAYWGELTETAAVDVLASATSVSAEALGLDDRGVLAEGKRADVLVVEGDPLEDLEALQEVRHVFRGGEQVL